MKMLYPIKNKILPAVIIFSFCFMSNTSFGQQQATKSKKEEKKEERQKKKEAKAKRLAAL
jgi:hypothetical protein